MWKLIDILVKVQIKRTRLHPLHPDLFQLVTATTQGTSKPLPYIYIYIVLLGKLIAKLCEIRIVALLEMPSHSCQQLPIVAPIVNSPKFGLVSLRAKIILIKKS